MKDLRVTAASHASGIPTAADTARVPRHSLRAKGFVLVLALVAYVLAASAHVFVEGGRMQAAVDALQDLARHEKALALTEAALDSALVDVQEAGSALATEPMQLTDLAHYMETCGKLFGALDEFDPGYAKALRQITRSHDALVAEPLRANWIDLREAMTRTAAELQIRHSGLAERRDELTQAYHRKYEVVVFESAVLALLGLVAFGSLMGWFFTRLARDIGRLEAHARQVVHGERGVVLKVNRRDELGSLMQAVNRMSADLNERERQITLDNQHRSHQEKMSAVGALAAGVAHEVNNPLAVITGTAQEIKTLDPVADAPRIAQAADVIVQQAQRAAWTARHLAELAQPPSASLDWVDVNAVVRRVVELMRYDKRYRRLQFDTELDAALPAVHTRGDAVQHVLMLVTTLLCDAAVSAPDAGRTVCLRTRAPPGKGVVEVVAAFDVRLDFGNPTVQRALLLSRSIIEPLRGRLALGQDAPPHLHLTLSLPSEGGAGV